MLCPYQLTEDGFEMQFGTNHLGSTSFLDFFLSNDFVVSCSAVVDALVLMIPFVADLRPLRLDAAVAAVADQEQGARGERLGFRPRGLHRRRCSAHAQPEHIQLCRSGPSLLLS